MNTRINLLPYRELRLAFARRQFFYLCAAAVGAAAAAIVILHGAISGYIALQAGRNAFLSSEIKDLDGRIQEIKRLQAEIESLKARKSVIEALQFDRGSAVQIADQFARLTPDGVYLKSLKQSGRAINVSGYAASNDLVSDLMVAIAKSPHLENPVLVEIKSAKDGDRRLAEFSLNLSLAKPKEIADAAEDRKGEAK